MRRNQYSVEQIIAILKQHEGGRPARELCRQYGFSDQTLKRWKNKYKGMHVEEAKRLKSLEEENRRLKHVIAELSLEKRALEAALEKVVTVPARRQIATFFRSEFALSERQACRLIGLHRSTSRYSRQRGEDKELRLRLHAWASRHPRWGYRFLHWALRQEGFAVNRKRVYRLYCEEGLRIRRRRRKQVAAAPREKIAAPTRANERWSMDFMSDELEDGRPLRLLNIVDDFTRECPGIEVDRSLPAARVIALLERIGEERGFTETIVVDNGPEFASKALHAWAYRRGVQLHFIDPGKPVQNAFIESFNGTCRYDCLNQELFIDVQDAKRKIESWRRQYNEDRPHSSLGLRTPADFARRARGLRPRPPK